MNQMKKMIQWMKGNMAIVVALALSVAGLCFVGVVTFIMRGAVVSSVEKQVFDQSKKADDLSKQEVLLPGQEAGSPMIRQRNVVANKALIAAKTLINDRFAKTGLQMRELSRKLNAGAHEQYCILLPEGGLNTINKAEVWSAYKDGFAAALSNPKLPGTPGSDLTEDERKRVAINPLYAGGPWSSKDLQEKADAAAKRQLKDFGTDKMADLSAEQQKQVENAAKNAVFEALRTRAESIGIYAEAAPESSANPFSGLIRDWGKDVPPPELVYECQSDLWILRDMVEALRRANHIGEEGHSVLNGPVKRLLRFQIGRDYVGLHSLGMLSGSGVGGALAAPGVALPPETQAQVENFFVSPTGRISNSIYDVKHARLEVLVDVRKLPELLTAIDSVNAMTVISVNLEDVDEYKELREGMFYYGQCDVVKANILVETLWMRSWTTQKMPEATKKYLGINP